MTYTTPVVSSSKKMNNVNKGLVIQELVESIVSWQWRATIAPYERSASSWGPRRSQRIRKSVISDDYKVYVSEEYASQEYVREEFQMEGDPTSFKEAMRSNHSLKWLEAMQGEWNRWIPTMFGT
jgi:hypothetical protein